MGYIIKLKKGPFYKKGPPLLGTDLEQGGAFLKCNSERKFGPNFDFTLLKLRFSRQKLFKKRAKSSNFSPAAGSGQEESLGRGLNKVKYQMFMIFISEENGFTFTQEVSLPKAKSMVGLTVFFCIRYCKHPAPWRSLQNRLHVQRLVCPVVYLTTTL